MRRLNAPFPTPVNLSLAKELQECLHFQALNTVQW